jgi:hypothetical protein
VQASTVGTDHLVTPQTNPLDISTPLNNIANINMPNQKQQQQQAQAMRLLQMAAGSAAKGAVSPNVLHNLFQQAKNGNLDPNGQPMQQIKNLILMQQQQHLAKTGTGQGGTPTGSASLNGVNSEMIVQAAMLQQRQAQAAGGTAASGAGMQGMNGNGNVPAPQQRQSHPKIWQGSIVWQPNNGQPCKFQTSRLGLRTDLYYSLVDGRRVRYGDTWEPPEYSIDLGSR